MIKEFERIILNENIPEKHLIKGDIGSVVMIYENGKAYEVEFITITGKTVAVVTLDSHQIRQIRKNEISHVREFEEEFA